MFPISDDNPRLHVSTPYVNYGIIAVCVVVFLWQLSAGSAGEERTIVSLGMIPARVFGHGELPPELVVVPAWAERQFKAEGDLVLFSYSDRATQERLSLWREQLD